MKFRVVANNYVEGTFDTLKEAIEYAENCKKEVMILGTGISVNTINNDEWAVIGSRYNGNLSIIDKYKSLI